MCARELLFEVSFLFATRDAKRANGCQDSSPLARQRSEQWMATDACWRDRFPENSFSVLRDFAPSAEGPVSSPSRRRV